MVAAARNERALAATAVFLIGGCLSWTWASHGGGVTPLHLWLVAVPGMAMMMLATRHLNPARATLPWLLAIAATLRLLGVAGAPILEDDHYRYLWDGYRLVEHGTPYGVAPFASFGDSSLPQYAQNLLSGINNADVPTIYGPVLQALFGLSHLIAPGQLWPLQSLLSLIDLGMLALLWQLGARRGAWLYGLCPLVVKEIAFTAHPDGVMAMLLVIAVLARRKATPNAAIGCGIAAGLAVAAKINAVVALPFLLWGLSPLAWLAAPLAIGVAYLPFLDGATDFAGLQVFARFWVYNPALFGVASAAFGDAAARKAMVAIFALIALCLLVRQQRRPPPTPRLDLLLGALLVCAPTINPWYLLWSLPFAALYPSRTAWTAAATLPLAYAHDRVLYVLPAWAIVAQFLPIAVAFLLDCRAARRPREISTQL
ncbi:hypothetical protein [Nevskia sp.]|uniref:hypothetical protein n=1 Tax=Nevskia sp. TaxID=1929292 RepID=UPI0025F20799|nr:hypothetical protein [Nevskia sp.]